MRVLFVSSEIYPLAKTGGLADVSSALPKALAHLGADVRLMLPGYPQALDQVLKKRVEADLGDLLGTGRARVIAGQMPDTGLPVWLVDCPQLYRRGGGLYQDADGREWPDNEDRFALLCHAGAELAWGTTATQWRPDIVHANDWHTGLLPALLATTPRPRPATLLTIHNVAFQGNFPAETCSRLGMPEQLFSSGGAEFYGQVSFLKAGIRYSDLLTTVSPTYAREILTPDFGHGMDGVLRERENDLVGVLNGVDYEIWDPSNDPYLARPFSLGDLSGKKACKARLQQELGFEVDPGIPLIAFISRLTPQKMADIVLEAMPWLLTQNVQFALLSDGDRNFERAFVEIARSQSEKAWVRIGYEEPLAHRLQGGADILLAPARFEPCGLTHLYSLRYGTLPIVRDTGGLADTVVDAGRHRRDRKKGSGFVFRDATVTDMITSIEHALSLFQDPLAWRRVQLQAMGENFGWRESAARYLSLYRMLAVSGPDKSRAHEADSIESACDAQVAV